MASFVLSSLRSVTKRGLCEVGSAASVLERAAARTTCARQYALPGRAIRHHRRTLATVAAKESSASSSLEDTKEKGGDTKVELSFEYPKAQALYERILEECKGVEDVKRLADYVNGTLGRPLRPNSEFYFNGFGGASGRGGAAKQPAGGGSSDQGSGGEEAAPAKTTVDIKLTSFEQKSKIKVIKEVRAIVAGLGLKEAKQLVESIPKVVMKDVKTEAAQELVDRLKAAGAQVELV